MLRQSIDDDEDDDEDDDDDEDRHGGVRYADRGTYMRCVACTRDHRPCDRRLPSCLRCASVEECIYPKRTEYGSNREALEAIVAAHRKHSFKRSSGESRSFTARPSVDRKAPRPLPSISWQEGDISHSQKKCPLSISNMIRDNRKDFEDSMLAGLWGNSKSVYVEGGRDCIYVDEETNEDISVARYIYGDTKQFFVAWCPAQDASNPSIPVVCKFRVFNNESNVRRNGRLWRPLRWRTWCPTNNAYHHRELFRLVATSVYNQHTSVGTPDILDLDTNPETGYGRSVVSNARSGDSTEDDMDEEDQQRPRKRIKTAEVVRSWKTHPRLVRAQAPNGKFLPRNTVSANDHKSDPTRIAHNTQQAGNYLVREPQRKGPPLAVVFRDNFGKIEGSYPYHECDTAEKLFDVACVTRIARIEPPATRLSKVEFEGGGNGCIRPDSASDFEKVFQAELKKLKDAVPNTSKLKVTISPYR